MQISSSINTHNPVPVSNIATHTQKASSEETAPNDATEDRLKQQNNLQSQDTQKAIAQTTGIGISLNLLA